MKQLKTLVLVGSLAVGMLVVGGCSKPTATAPELQSLAGTKAQDDILVSRVTDNQLRSIWDDLGRMFFFDSNNRLGPYVAP